jgi:hypothetical protein
MTMWEPTVDAAHGLQRMLRNVEWGRPLEGAQAQCIEECAEWVLAGYTTNPLVEWSLDTDRLRASICLWAEAVLHWVTNPQDQNMIDRVRLAEETLVRIQTELDFDDE